MRRVRVVRAVVGVLLLIAVLATAAWWQRTRQNAALIAQMLVDAEQLSAPVQLQPLREPAAGDVISCFSRRVVALPAGAEHAGERESQRLMQVRDGLDDVENVSAQTWAALDALSGWATSARACVRSVSVAPAPGADAFELIRSRPYPGLSMSEHLAATRLPEGLAVVGVNTTFRAARARTEAEADEALAACVDSLALASAFAWEGQLSTWWSALRSQLVSCASAVPRASREGRERFAAELQVLEQRAVPLRRVLELERVRTELQVYGFLVPPAARERLRPGMRQRVEMRWVGPGDSTLVRTWVFRTHDRVLRAAEDAVERPPAERDATLRALERRVMLSVLPDFARVDFAPTVERYEASRAAQAVLAYVTAKSLGREATLPAGFALRGSELTSSLRLLSFFRVTHP